METKKLSERPEWDITQRDRERERCRVRDRERRQSMSLEEREKHLARRRRNYQLRQQREHKVKCQSGHTSTAIRSQIHPWNGNQSSIAVSGLSLESDGALQLDAEDGAHKSAKLPKRLRLNHIRHLARLLNSPTKESYGGSYQIGADVTAKEIVPTVATHCRSRKMLHLTHLKRLSRALSSIVKQNKGQNHLGETEENQSGELNG